MLPGYKQRRRLEGLLQHLYNIKGIYSTYHGSDQRRIFNIRVPRWLERAILGVLVVSGGQKEYPNVFSQKSTYCSPSPPLAESKGVTVPAAPVLQASLTAMPIKAAILVVKDKKSKSRSKLCFIL